jgi:hypothetical protein
MERCRIVEYAETIYSILLCLYPVRFRRRFGREMACVFRESCYEQLQVGGPIACVALWLHTVKDLVVSAGHERLREVISRSDLDHPVFRVIDLTLIPTIVVSNLIVLGTVVTILFFRVMPGHAVSANEFVITSGTVSVVFGILGVISSAVIRRLRPTVRLWVKLS